MKAGCISEWGGARGDKEATKYREERKGHEL